MNKDHAILPRLEKLFSVFFVYEIIIYHLCNNRTQDVQFLLIACNYALWAKSSNFSIGSR